MPSEPRGVKIDARGLELALPGAGGVPLPVLSGLDVEVEPGEFVALVGPSGCGKSTLLACLAGLRSPDLGEVRIDGAPVRAGDLTLMPQGDSLLAWRTTRENVQWGAEISGRNRTDSRAEADRLLRRVGLTGFEDHYPHALSGGMRQRAALARTLLAGGRGWLLDEPFGALDAITRSDLHALLSGIHAEHRPTIVMVTHDLDEALDLADRIVVMSDRPTRPVTEASIAVPPPGRRSADWAPERARLRTVLLDALRPAPSVA